MDDSKWERWGALGGILFVLTTIVVIILPGSPPTTSDPTSDMVKFIVDKGDQIRWAGYLGALSVVFLVWWLGSLWRLMRRHEGDSPRLTIVAFGGAIFALTMATVSGIMLGALPIIGVKTLGPGGTRAFYVIATNLGISSIFGITLLVGASGILMVRTRMLSPWLGWFGILIAVIALVGGCAVASTRDALWGLAFASFLGMLLWVLIASILMLRSAPEAA